MKALLDFSGRVAVITGGGSGLGAGIGRRFAEGGAAVVVHHQTNAPGAEALVRATDRREKHTKCQRCGFHW